MAWWFCCYNCILPPLCVVLGNMISRVCYSLRIYPSKTERDVQTNTCTVHNRKHIQYIIRSHFIILFIQWIHNSRFSLGSLAYLGLRYLASLVVPDVDSISLSGPQISLLKVIASCHHIYTTTVPGLLKVYHYYSSQALQVVILMIIIFLVQQYPLYHAGTWMLVSKKESANWMPG